jgi:hypothetical protein
MTKKRDYSYDTRYENSPEQIKNREARNKARYDVEHHIHTKLKVHKGEDIDHKKSLKGGGSNKPSNWRVRSKHSNRGDKTFK